MLDRAVAKQEGTAGESRPRILIVDDETTFSAELRDLLQRYGFDVGIADSLPGMAEVMSGFSPNILILDQFLRGLDVVPLIGQIRGSFSGGLMVLSGNSDMTDKVLALEQGADDFVTKTTHPREVLARLRALARRNSMPPAVVEVSQEPNRGGWAVDATRRAVRTPKGDVVALTGLEFDAFQLLNQTPGRVVSRESLAKEVLQRHVCASGRSIENLVSRIRAKFALHVGGLPIIRSVRGKGYVFLGFP